MGKFFVKGTVEPGFEPVKELFVKNVERGAESNAQLCIYHRGKKVVDLWGSERGDPNFGPDTLMNIFSSTKTITAICIASMVDIGLLSYDEKVVKYWPEFGKHGKDQLTLADILRHEGGMPTLAKTLKWTDFSRENIKNNAIGEVIEDTQPHFPPKEAGTTREYHAMSRGWILNEIFRRVEPSRRTIGEFLLEEISQPLGIDVYIGVPESKLDSFCDLKVWSSGKLMVQSMIPYTLGRKMEPSMGDFLRVLKVFINARDSMKGEPKRQPLLEGMEKVKNPNQLIPKFNTNEVRLGEMPSANGSCSARGLAKLAQCILNGGEFDDVRILSTTAVENMVDKPLKRFDHAFVGVQSNFSQGGVNHFVINSDDTEQQKQAKRYRDGYVGWFGMGGSIFQWHPKHEIAFGFIPSLMHWYDLANLKAAKYQEETIKCAKKMSLS
eukprot:maker-scaffold50_size457468-snap-gene-1.14 protein:Tk03206 transcript:maker-scaffold50_size457468-snap-gene-1.14-mRNA-1 annotation:"beta-lactamase class c and other penicillin binding protein"